MSTKKSSDTQKQQEQFAQSCAYLGLKLLGEEYQRMVDRAIKDNVGYYDFISDVVHAETMAKRQRRIEYLVKSSRLPQPLKMLQDL